MKRLLMISLMSLSLVISPTVNAEEYCFTEEEIEQLYKDVKERDLLKETNESLERTIELKDLQLKARKEQVQIYEEQHKILTESIRESRSLSTWERVAWFGLGVLGTSLAVYGASKIIR